MFKKQGGECMNRLRELRKSKGLKQSDVAKLINKTIQAYSLYELNKRNIDNDALKKLSEFYEVSIGYILGTEVEPQPALWELQLFTNPAKKNEYQIAQQIGALLSLKDERSKQLTLQIVEDVIHLTIPQLEALSALIKTIK